MLHLVIYKYSGSMIVKNIINFFLKIMYYYELLLQ